eukprot:1422027-Pyramimonas_sp.AAC.1
MAKVTCDREGDATAPGISDAVNVGNMICKNSRRNAGDSLENGSGWRRERAREEFIITPCASI